jgi:uncharacterized protein (DUF2384 family)
VTELEQIMLAALREAEAELKYQAMRSNSFDYRQKFNQVASPHFQVRLVQVIKAVNMAQDLADVPPSTASRFSHDIDIPF